MERRYIEQDLLVLRRQLEQVESEAAQLYATTQDNYCRYELVKAALQAAVAEQQTRLQMEEPATAANTLPSSEGFAPRCNDVKREGTPAREHSTREHSVASGTCMAQMQGMPCPTPRIPLPSSLQASQAQFNAHGFLVPAMSSDLSMSAVPGQLMTQIHGQPMHIVASLGGLGIAPHFVGGFPGDAFAAPHPLLSYISHANLRPGTVREDGHRYASHGNLRPGTVREDGLSKCTSCRVCQTADKFEDGRATCRSCLTKKKRKRAQMRAENNPPPGSKAASRGQNVGPESTPPALEAQTPVGGDEPSHAENAELSPPGTSVAHLMPAQPSIGGNTSENCNSRAAVAPLDILPGHACENLRRKSTD
jgi:hypothetical protein